MEITRKTKYKRSESERFLEDFKLELPFERGVSLSCRCLDGGGSAGLEHMGNTHLAQGAVLGSAEGGFLFILFFCNQLKNRISVSD